MNQQLRPARVFPPGRVLSEELEARGWTQKDLGTIINRPPQTINEIIRGTKQITPETALELAAAFGTSAEFWMGLESNYRLHLARKKKDEQEIVRKSQLYSLAPIPELIKFTLRHDRIDAFWFTLKHELGHIIAGHRGMYLDNFDECNVDDEENAANQIARD